MKQILWDLLDFIVIAYTVVRYRMSWYDARFCLRYHYYDLIQHGVHPHEVVPTPHAILWAFKDLEL